jgi:hypothetical protein
MLHLNSGVLKALLRLPNGTRATGQRLSDAHHTAHRKHRVTCVFGKKKKKKGVRREYCTAAIFFSLFFTRVPGAVAQYGTITMCTR